MEEKWSCYRGGQFREGECTCYGGLMEGEWSCYRGG